MRRLPHTEYNLILSGFPFQYKYTEKEACHTFFALLFVFTLVAPPKTHIRTCCSHRMFLLFELIASCVECRTPLMLLKASAPNSSTTLFFHYSNVRGDGTCSISWWTAVTLDYGLVRLPVHFCRRCTCGMPER